MLASPPPPPEAGEPRFTRLLDELGLVAEAVLDRSDDYLTVRVRDAAGDACVIKYCHSGAPDALRRLRNEALLTRHLPTRPPLRLLRHRADGPAYLVTAFEPGEPLGPRHLGDAALMPRIAEALVLFQSLDVAVAALPLRGRESTRRFLRKLMTKHLLHLWPRRLGLRDAWCAWRALDAGLDDIDSLAVPCHADLLPTNMLRDADGEAVVFIDLEGFIAGHHPLYDVLSFFTIDGAALDAWRWQRDFLHHYLARSPLAPHLAAGSPRFARVYRALLVFLLAYRYNEAAINAVGGHYFGGGSKPRWVLARLALLLSGAGFLAPRAALTPELAVRRDNLRTALDPVGFARHLAFMLGHPPDAVARAA